MKATLTSKAQECAILVSLISIFFADDWGDLPELRTRNMNTPSGREGYGISVKFKNGYSGSVVCHSWSYGGDENLWELAVTYGGELVYDTPITDDVIGHMDKEEVLETLLKIKSLPPREEDAA